MTEDSHETNTRFGIDQTALESSPIHGRYISLVYLFVYCALFTALTAIPRLIARIVIPENTYAYTFHSAQYRRF